MKLTLQKIADLNFYLKIINDARDLITDTRLQKKKEKAYEQLLNLIDEFNLKILSTKVYWDNNAQKQAYREFWKKYQEIDKIEDAKEKAKKREILFVRNDLSQVRQNENKYEKLINFYKSRLVELGDMKRLNSKASTLEDKVYIKGLEKKKSKTKRSKVKGK